MTLPRPEPAPKLVRMHAVELDDGPRLARVVTRLRALARRRPLQLHDCPQLLAHTLYKAGLLRDGSIAIASMREEEPHG